MLVIGLPGNPVSSIVCGLLFVVPAIRAMLGDPQAGADRTEPAFSRDLPANDGRADYMRAGLTMEAGNCPSPPPRTGRIRPCSPCSAARRRCSSAAASPRRQGRRAVPDHPPRPAACLRRHPPDLQRSLRGLGAQPRRARLAAREPRGEGGLGLKVVRRPRRAGDEVGRALRGRPPGANPPRLPSPSRGRRSAAPPGDRARPRSNEPCSADRRPHEDGASTVPCGRIARSRRAVSVRQILAPSGSLAVRVQGSNVSPRTAGAIQTVLTRPAAVTADSFFQRMPGEPSARSMKPPATRGTRPLAT